MNNPLLTEYTREPWMMEPERLRQFMAAAADHPTLSQTLAALRVETTLPYRVEGDASVIPISGTLLKTVPGWARVFGWDVTGYDEIRQMLSAAVDDRRTTRIELQISSPGGMVAGGMETADAIRSADAVKPVTAVIQDLGASGAYWLALSARRIEANANAEVGSIGVYTYVVDDSQFWKDRGVQWIVVRSGPHKGMGIDGVTSEQLAAMQDVIDGMAGHFIDQVAVGRNVPRDKASEWATGKVWLAPAALEMGLIDAITPSQAKTKSIDDLDKESIVGTPSPEATVTLDAASTAVATASDPASAVAAERSRISRIKAAFPTDAAFALEAIEAGWDVTEAKAVRHDRLAQRPDTSGAGAQAIDYADSATGHEEFMAQARRLSREQNCTMTEAMRRVQAEDPDAYAAFRESEQRRTVTTKGGRRTAQR